MQFIKKLIIEHEDYTFFVDRTINYTQCIATGIFGHSINKKIAILTERMKISKTRVVTDHKKEIFRKCKFAKKIKKQLRVSLNSKRLSQSRESLPY